MEAPGYFYGSYCGGRTPQFAVEQQGKTCDQFVVDDLLDFSNEEDSSLGRGDEVGPEIVQVNSADGSLVRAADSSSNSSGYDPHFSGDLGCRSFADAGLSDDLCALVKYDEVAELEWLSNFVEESFSSDDMQKLQFMSDLVKSPTSSSSHTRSGLSTAQGRCSSEASELLSLERHVPGKPRSRRSRLPPTSWSSRLLVLSPATYTTESHSWRAASARKKTPKAPKRDGVEGAATPVAVGRKCLHCASERTPQWRAGPMGPKTLCNACGVRYKSGRLVPEYRPAASPTFVLSEHSNSHRKVLVLRRQKEMLQQQQQQQRNRSGSPGPSCSPARFTGGLTSPSLADRRNSRWM